MNMYALLVDDHDHDPNVAMQSIADAEESQVERYWRCGLLRIGAL
jgi:hypothetical protein